MQRIIATISAVLLTSAMLLPEDSAFLGVMEKTCVHVRNLAKESQRQTEQLVRDFDKSLVKIEKTGRRAIKRMIDG